MKPRHFCHRHLTYYVGACDYCGMYDIEYADYPRLTKASDIDDLSSFTGRLYSEGTITYYSEGLVHREGGPARVARCGDIEYIQEGVLHREDAPAAFSALYSKEFWSLGKLHNPVGAAVTYSTGVEKFYYRGLLHNLNGPALPATISAPARYYILGQEYTREAYTLRIQEIVGNL